MKPFKIFLLVAVMLSTLGAVAQRSNVFLKRDNNKLFNYGSTAQKTTTDSTLTYIDSITVNSNEAGVVEVQLVGFNDSTKTAVTGSLTARYVVSGGTLTLGTPAAILTSVTDATLGTAAWTIVANNNKIMVRVKGKAAFTIRWFANTRRIYLKT